MLAATAGDAGSVESSMPLEDETPQPNFIRKLLKPLRDFGFGQKAFIQGGVGLFIYGGVGAAH